MSDKELLELAAKAAGIRLEWDFDPAKWQPQYYEGKTYHSWNPLTDDGDALRLAVKLNLDILQDPMGGTSNNVDVCANDHESPDAEETGCMCWATEERGDDPYAATRRAIVRAAAAIGETL